MTEKSEKNSKILFNANACDKLLSEDVSPVSLDKSRQGGLMCSTAGNAQGVRVLVTMETIYGRIQEAL